MKLNIRRVATGLGAGVMTLSMAVPAMAADTAQTSTGAVTVNGVRITPATIDTSLKGSLTLYKILDETGKFVQADGLKKNDTFTPVSGAVFSYWKIADIETLADSDAVGEGDLFPRRGVVTGRDKGRLAARDFEPRCLNIGMPTVPLRPRKRNRLVSGYPRLGAIIRNGLGVEDVSPAEPHFVQVVVHLVAQP